MSARARPPASAPAAGPPCLDCGTPISARSARYYGALRCQPCARIRNPGSFRAQPERARAVALERHAQQRAERAELLRLRQLVGERTEPAA